MQDSHSKSDDANMLVEQLGSDIVNDPFYRSEPWDRLALVIELDLRRRMYGYLYVGDAWEAGSPDGIEPLETAAKLREVMHAASGASWRKCLVRVDRATAKIDIDFDYQGTL